MSSANAKVSLKVVCDGVVRRFHIAREFSALQQLITNDFQSQMQAGYVLRFEDDEGDLCLITNKVRPHPPWALPVWITQSLRLIVCSVCSLFCAVLCCTDRMSSRSPFVCWAIPRPL
jgi:hypothetical protein